MSKTKSVFIAFVVAILMLTNLTGCDGMKAPATPTPTPKPNLIYVIFWHQTEETEVRGMVFITEFSDRTDCYGDGICFRVHYLDNFQRDQLLEFAFINLKKRYPELSTTTQYGTFGETFGGDSELWGIRIPLPLPSLTSMSIVTPTDTPAPTATATPMPTSTATPVPPTATAKLKQTATVTPTPVMAPCWKCGDSGWCVDDYPVPKGMPCPDNCDKCQPAGGPSPTRTFVPPIPTPRRTPTRMP